MKPTNRGRRHLLIPLSVAGVWLAGAGGTGGGGEASEPVLWDSAAAPVELAAAKVPAAPEVQDPKRDVEAARAKAAELEKSLAQEKKRREKALDDLASVGKQLNAIREETARLRRKSAEGESAAARIRELENRLEQTNAERAESGRQLEAVRAEAVQLRKTLEEAQIQSKAATKAGEQALGKQLRLQRQTEAAQQAAEARAQAREKEAAQAATRIRELEQMLAGEPARVAATLERRNAEQALALQALETQSQKERAALRKNLAEAEKALAQARTQTERLKADGAAAQKSLAAQAATEARMKSLEQEQAKAAARVRELEQMLANQRASAAEKDKELARSGEQVRRLQGEIAALQSAGQAAEETAAAARKKQAAELAEARGQIERLAATVAELQKDQENRAAQLAAKEQRHAQLIAEHKKDQAACAAELGEVRAQLKQAAAEQQRLRAQLKDEEWIRQGKALREQLGPEDNAALVGSLNDVGLALQAEGKLDQAEEMFRRALVVLDRTSGRSGAAAGTILQHLADVGWARNDLDAAAANYEEAARQFSAALGDNHPRHAATLNGLARVRRDQQRPQEAEELYRMAIHVYERHQAKHPADLVVPLHNLALLLMEQGRLDEAGPLLERAVLLAEKSGLKKGDAQVVLRTMIRYCQAAGDVERAAEFEKRADELALDVWAK